MHVATIVAHGLTQPSTVNDRGNTVHRWHRSSERYVVDFADDFKREGWEQFDTDQDAWYFGQWINRQKRMTLCYCEGDWSLVVCPTDETYFAEIRSAIEFYGEGKIATAIEQDGSVTTYHQDRSEFLKAG